MKKTIVFLSILLSTAIMFGASGFSVRNSGYGTATFEHTTKKMDSCWFVYYYRNPGALAAYAETVSGYPSKDDSGYVCGVDSIDLDSVGGYFLEIVYFLDADKAAPHTDSVYEAGVHYCMDINTTGGGPNAETLLVLSTSDTTAIEGVDLTVKTLDQSTTKTWGATDVNGLEIFELPASDYYIIARHNNYTATTDTITVASGGGTDTLWMTVFSPSAPSYAGGCVIYGWTSDMLGDTLAGAKLRIVPVFKSPNWKDSVGILVIPGEQTGLSDSTGYFEKEIYRSNYLVGMDWAGTETSDTLKYDIYLEKSGISRKFKLTRQYISTDSLRLGE